MTLPYPTREVARTRTLQECRWRDSRSANTVRGRARQIADRSDRHTRPLVDAAAEAAGAPRLNDSSRPMARARRSYSQAEVVALTTEVDGRCPICDRPLFYTKKVGKPPVTRQFARYELAHIYPLNPKPDELHELAGVERLHEDVNDPANLIPLCTDCHTQFDKPRTRGEYEELATKKRDLLAEAAQRALRLAYPIEDEIHRVVERLHAQDATFVDEDDLEYDPKRLAEKFDDTLPRPTRHKIRGAVSGYYSYIRSEFAELERRSPTSSILIFSQVRSFYFKQKALGLPQVTIFANTVRWISDRTSPGSSDAAELVAAFFVQNCEVFE